MNGVGTMNQSLSLLGTPEGMNQENLRNIRIAMSKGYKFIQLTHHKPGSIPERVYPVDGIMVTIRHNSMTKSNEAIVTQQEGKEMLFIPDPDTGIRTAYILDTPFNRRILATHLLEDRWSIDDPVIKKEIVELSETIPQTVDTSKMHESASSQSVVTHEDVVKGMSEKQLDESIQAKRKELELLENTQKEKVTKKENEHPDEAIPEKEKAAPGQIVSNELKDRVPPDILERATSVVYQRNATIIAGLKSQFGDEDFIKSDEFQKNIQPQINAELLRVMDSAQGPEEKTEDKENANNEGAAAGATV